jgi:predicted hydrocarbon binding protein
MMSLSNGVVKIEIKDGKTVLNIVKHPKVNPTRIIVPIDKSWEKKIFDAKFWDREMLRRLMREEQVHREFKVNIFWPNLAFWSCMNWDPKRFPMMTYEVWKEFGGLGREMLPLYPWHNRFFLKIFTPKDFSKVKDMKKISKYEVTSRPALRGDGILEYLKDVSKTDEHYFRIYENRECWGFGNVNSALSSIFPPMLAGFFKGLEAWRGLERDWNIIETKCVGLGDPHCELKLVPGEIDGLKDSLEKDISIIERIHSQLIDRLRGFLLYDRPFKERPRLGNYFLMEHPDITLPAMAGERYRMALRMGGARVGKEVGENLMGAGIREDEAVKRILKLFDYFKVGEVSVGETIRIKENCESLYTKYYMNKWEEPLCFFTTGFLNGFFSVVKNKHLKETKCIATGDPYCEWEFS